MVFLISAKTGVLSTTQGLRKHPSCSSVCGKARALCGGDRQTQRTWEPSKVPAGVKDVRQMGASPRCGPAPLTDRRENWAKACT